MTHARTGNEGLAGRAAFAAAWTISAGLATRVLGMLGTLLLTYFLAPDVLGEVSGASILVVSANQLGTLGVGQYIIAKRDTAGRDVVWHATVIHQLLGIAVIIAVFAAQHSIARFLHSPNLTRFVPGLLLSVLIDRISFVPERILARDMRFGALSAARTTGEIAYSVCSVALASAGLGGMAVVLANVLRSVTRAAMVLVWVDRREWLSRYPLSRKLVRELLRFGWPLCIGSTAQLAARRWDNLGIERLFGPWVMGEYNQAYNLAEIPGAQIGEQIGDVLLPTLARLGLEDRKRALVRALGLMSLLVFPLAVGLGAVAPALVHALLGPRWQGIAPMVTILSVMSIARPFGWMISAYLQARDRLRVVLWLDVTKVLSLVGLIAVLGSLGGPLWACAGVGLAYGANALAGMWTVQRLDGVRMTAFLVECGGALFACVPMVLAVMAAATVLNATAVPRGVGVALEIAVGGVAYVAAALVIARRRSADLLRLLRGIAGSRSRRGIVKGASAPRLAGTDIEGS